MLLGVSQGVFRFKFRDISQLLPDGPDSCVGTAQGFVAIGPDPYSGSVQYKCWVLAVLWLIPVPGKQCSEAGTLCYSLSSPLR